MPDTELHRICRRCQKWFFPSEGSIQGPEVTGPLGAMEAMRAAAGDRSVLRFECHRCSRIRRNTKLGLWLGLGALIGLVLLLARLGVIR
jgi:hypothetical protein